MTGGVGLISVIVPVYNVEPYLNRCIDSIVRQSYTDLEIILVDDGSPDKSGKMCDEWADRDARIKVIHKENGGLSEARNTGIEAATGEYFGFVDSDDWIEADMYQDLLRTLETQHAELAVTGIIRDYGNGFNRSQYLSDTPFVLCGDGIVQAYLQQGVFSTAVWDKLFTKKLFEHRRFPAGKQYEDAPVIFDILCDVKTMAVVGKPQYHYFQRADSICGKPFSERKMDHYAFSREIWLRARHDYPQYADDADAFWGCKLCELLYAVLESPNAEEYRSQKKQMLSELKRVFGKVLRASKVPGIIKGKTALLMVHLASLYIKIKALVAQRTTQ